MLAKNICTFPIFGLMSILGVKTWTWSWVYISYIEVLTHSTKKLTHLIPTQKHKQTIVRVPKKSENVNKMKQSFLQF